MVFSFVLSFSALALVLLIIKKNRQAILILSLGFIISFFFGLPQPTKVFLSQLQNYPQLQNPPWKERNVIILLGSGQAVWENSGHISPQKFGLSRLLEAVRLYLNCRSQNKTCVILAVGGDPNQSGKSEADTFATLLKQAGVSENDIMLEHESKHTYENAKNAAPIIKQLGFDNWILVTSGFHMKRALICFKLNGIYPLPAPAELLMASNTVYPNSTNLYYVNIVFHELGGIIKAYILNMLG